LGSTQLIKEQGKAKPSKPGLPAFENSHVRHMDAKAAKLAGINFPVRGNKFSLLFASGNNLNKAWNPASFEMLQSLWRLKFSPMRKKFSLKS